MSDKRIIAKDLQEDLYDGHILKLLVGKLNKYQIIYFINTVLNV